MPLSKLPSNNLLLIRYHFRNPQGHLLMKAEPTHVVGRKSLPGKCFRFLFVANLPAITAHLNLGIVANRYSGLSKFTINDSRLIV
jgi:hypothetical protein